MIGPVEPKYQWGEKVVVLEDLVNDGTYPEHPDDALLVPRGGCGEVVQVGIHSDSNTVVYMVEFGPRMVVGCRELELARMEDES
jgi:nitrogen fixation protein NifZ